MSDAGAGATPLCPVFESAIQGFVFLQNRPAPARLEVQCGRYRAVLMTPEHVSDAWVQWVADPLIMLPLGVQPRRTDKQQLARYVMQMHAKQRAVIGILGGKPEQHIGLLEVTFDRKHLTATIEVLIDTRRHDFANVSKEVLPHLLSHLAKRFKIEKFSAFVPETNLQALAYYSNSDWSFEAELREEVPSDAHKRRLDMKQFAWFPANAA